jgi:hypothetical protein
MITIDYIVKITYFLLSFSLKSSVTLLLFLSKNEIFVSSVMKGNDVIVYHKLQ